MLVKKFAILLIPFFCFSTPSYGSLRPLLCKGANLGNKYLHRFKKRYSAQAQQKTEGATSFTPSERQNPNFLYKDFKQWEDACAALPHYRTVGQDYSFKAAGFTWREMEKALTACTQVMCAQLNKNNDAWVGSKPPTDLFNLQKNKFWPYAQKLEVPVNTKIAFHGDIHGDVKSLLLYLKDLQKQGYLDSADAFKVKDPAFKMAFLGDYTDRGIYGAEVIYTLLRLKAQNPERVFLVRGNHEDHSLNAHYGFEAEMKAKFGDNADLKKLYNFYNLLPAVLYCGAGEKSQKNYFQCCHGGMEIGYLPNQLLKNPHSIAYEHIKMLARKTNIKEIVPDIAASNQLFEKYKIDDAAPQGPIDLGFLWSDFFVTPPQEDSNQPWVANWFDYNRGRGWIYGRAITNAILAANGIANNRVVGVIRAHQHDANMQGMMGVILNRNYPASLGVGKLWREQNNTGKDSLWPGIVCTFNLSPDTPQGAHRKAGFNFDTYALLKTGNQYPQDWSLDVHRIHQQFTGNAIHFGQKIPQKTQAT